MTKKSPTRPRASAQPALKARVVVVETVTHVPPRGEPTSIGAGFAALLETDEAPYSRPSGTFKVGPGWRPLDLGWLAEDGNGVSVVVLANVEGTDLQKVPTPDERAATESTVVEVGVVFPSDVGDEIVVPAFQVRPGHTFRAEPCDVTSIRVRCQAGTARCNLFLVPR